jgi:hypothetical protein
MVNGIEQGGTLLSLIHHEIPIGLPQESFLEPSFNYGQLLAFSPDTARRRRSYP